MITLQIAGNTPAEVAAYVKGFFEQLMISGDAGPAKDAVVEATATEVMDTATEAAKKAERKPRTKKDEPKQVDLEEAIAAKDPKPAPPVQDVRDALQKLAKAKGEDAVWNLLEKYKAKSASTVPEDKRAELIAEIAKECA